MFPFGHRWCSYLFNQASLSTPVAWNPEAFRPKFVQTNTVIKLCTPVFHYIPSARYKTLPDVSDFAKFTRVQLWFIKLAAILLFNRLLPSSLSSDASFLVWICRLLRRYRSDGCEVAGGLVTCGVAWIQRLRVSFLKCTRMFMQSCSIPIYEYPSLTCTLYSFFSITLWTLPLENACFRLPENLWFCPVLAHERWCS